jgi:acetyl esterase/lipase
VVKAIVPIYPVADFSVPPERKPATRRFKPELGGFRAKETDYLLRLAGVFDWAYCPAGGDAKDPGLSVGYVARGAIPKNVFVVGCEMDMLGYEAWRLACKLGEKEVTGTMVGREEVARRGELELEDERFFWEVKREDGGVIRWLLVPDALHGFDMELAGIPADKETLEDGRLKAEKMRTMIGQWLQEKAWSK